MGRGALPLLLALLAAGCGGGADAGEPVEVEVPRGASLSEVADTLAGRGLVDHPLLFRLYGKIAGAERAIRSGRYAFPADAGWRRILRDLTEGRVLTVPLTVPEGFTVREAAPRIADVVGVGVDSVLARLADTAAVLRWDVPGPTLEGYLFPETYRFAEGAPLDSVISAMTRAYRAYWTPGRRARADSLGLTLREATTLASIIQEEATEWEEMPLISAVYHNRLERGYLLQADPTVLYALDAHKDRLLFRDIERVADDPYNTYTHAGLPPGPIASPGEEALDAALSPADADYLYFVARPDGSHVFTRSLVEHNRAKEEVGDAPRGDSGPSSPGADPEG